MMRLINNFISDVKCALHAWVLHIRGIKHEFPFISICKVPREVLKTEGEAEGPCKC